MRGFEKVEELRECSFCQIEGKCITFMDAEQWSDEYLCKDCLLKIMALFMEEN